MYDFVSDQLRGLSLQKQRQFGQKWKVNVRTSYEKIRAGPESFHEFRKHKGKQVKEQYKNSQDNQLKAQNQM